MKLKDIGRETRGKSIVDQNRGRKPPKIEGNPLGTRIRELRIQKDWSQYELGTWSSIKHSHVSLIERGRVVPHSGTIHKLALALDTDEQELLALAGKAKVTNVVAGKIIVQYQGIEGIAPSIKISNGQDTMHLTPRDALALLYWLLNEQHKIDEMRRKAELDQYNRTISTDIISEA